ncbi:hypothetical protein ACOMHN_041148 [Nucella lapillus]
MKLTVILLLVLAALALVSGRRGHDSKRPFGERKVRVKSVVAWICRFLKKLDISDATTFCNGLTRHSKLHLPFTTRSPYPPSWLPYRRTGSTYFPWLPANTTRMPPLPWLHFNTTRMPPLPWLHFNTTRMPYPWLLFNTTRMPPLPWLHFNTTRMPPPPWLHFNTTRMPPLPWLHFNTTRMPYPWLLFNTTRMPPLPWLPANTTRMPYPWLPFNTTRMPNLPWLPFNTTRMPYPWSHFNTTRMPPLPWLPFNTTRMPYPWLLFNTTRMPPLPWLPANTTRMPYPWLPFNTTRMPNLPWLPFNTTRMPYPWLLFNTTRMPPLPWLPANTTQPPWFTTRVPPFPGKGNSTSPKPGRRFRTSFELTDAAKVVYDELLWKLGAEGGMWACTVVKKITKGLFVNGRRVVYQPEFETAAFKYYVTHCLGSRESTSPPPPPPRKPTARPVHVSESSNPSCGLSPILRRKTKASRIVGGKKTGSCDVIPWQVRLVSEQGLCGGSIISERHILTAAHCVNDLTEASQISVVVGDYDKDKTESTERTHTVKHFKFHERFNPTTYENDMALLTLEEPIDFSGRCVRPVCRDPSFVPSKMFCTVSGWGTTSSGGKVSQTLQMVQLLTVRGSECVEQFGIPENYPDYLTAQKDQLCAGKVSGGQDSCQGDSGGPLVCLHPTTHSFVQVGVVSYGVNCAVKGMPGVYSSVSAFNDWVDKAIEESP